MKYILFSFTLLGAISYAQTDLADNYKASTLKNCLRSGNSEASCQCVLDRFENNLDPEVWKAILITSDVDEIIKHSHDARQITYLTSMINSAEDQIKQIINDCNATK